MLHVNMALILTMIFIVHTYFGNIVVLLSWNLWSSWWVSILVRFSWDRTDAWDVPPRGWAFVHSHTDPSCLRWASKHTSV